MAKKRNGIDCYQIGNVYHPILYKLRQDYKDKRNYSKWTEALQSIKNWSASSESGISNIIK